MKKALTRNNNKNHKLIGMHDGLRGNCSWLRGDCSKLIGNCSELGGDCAGLSGDCSGLRGNCSWLSGDLDECEISREDRENGVSIEVLISDD